MKKKKKMIHVPVGAEAKISTYRNGGGAYIDYGYMKETIVPVSDLESLINRLQELQKEYKDQYQNMVFVEKRDCGCYNECSCSPSYILYGERYETDLEYNFRLRQKEKTKGEKEAREKLKAKFG